jgi:hypothetical protein
MNRNRTLLLIGVCLLAGVTLAGNAAAQEQEDSLEVQLASPGQGEIFYAAPGGVITSVPISGRVVSYDTPVELETVELTLTLIDNAGATTELQPPVGADGYFHVWATINPRGLVPILDDHQNDLCLTCHIQGELDMPTSVSQLLVHARTPDGLTGSAVRQITLDRGTPRSLGVSVVGLPEAAREARVMASTTIYEWRPRSFYGNLQDGQAAVTVEGLHYADLTYQVALVPILVGDTRYESDPVTVMLRAGTTEAPMVTIIARPVRGTITGRVVDGASREGVGATVLALDLLTGASRTAATAEDGSFELTDLPVSRHVLLAQSSAGFHVPGEYDLRQNTAQEATIHLSSGRSSTLRGTLTLDGHPMPFAQATVAGLIAAQADPLSGAFEVAAVPVEGEIEVEISAAGCFSQRLTSTERDLGTVALALHPATTVLTRGRYRLYLPAATLATHTGGIVGLQQGVLWVTGDPGGSMPGFEIRVGDYRLSGPGADYAIEALPDALPRLYVSQGEVAAARADGEPIMVAAGQTLTLASGVIFPATLVEGAGPLLRSLAGSVAGFELPPTAEEQRDALIKQVVVTIARGFLIGAYAIGYLIMPAAIVIGFALFLRRRLRRGPDR